MQLNTDLSRRVVLNVNAVPWVASPQPGVERCMLERDGDEVGLATTVVRYAPGSRFPAHVHPHGEELLVLDGIFADEHGEYTPGTYVRNPPGSRHAPFSVDGCTIFVKLCHMQANETERIVVDTTSAEWSGSPDQIQRLQLHADPETGGRVLLSRYAPGARIEGDVHTGGEEVYVIDGELRDEFGTYPAGTWLRQPHGSVHSPYSDSGCLLYVNRGHMPRH